MDTNCGECRQVNDKRQARPWGAVCPRCGRVYAAPCPGGDEGELWWSLTPWFVAELRALLDAEAQRELSKEERS